MGAGNLVIPFGDYLVSINVEDGERLYQYWLNNYAQDHIKKWLEEHNYNTDTCRSREYADYITNLFIDWVDKQ